MSEEKVEKKKKNSKVFRKLIFVLLFMIFLPFVIIFFSVRSIVKRSKKKKWEKSGVKGKALILQTEFSNIDKMEKYEFEEYLRTLFFYEGYGASLTLQKNDHGADIILTDQEDTIIVQVNRTKKIIDVKRIKDIIKTIKHYKATGGIVVTTSSFSLEAEAFAKEKSIQLVNRERLIEICASAKAKLKETTKESELVDKFDKNILDKFPHMI